MLPNPPGPKTTIGLQVTVILNTKPSLIYFANSLDWTYLTQDMSSHIITSQGFQSWSLVSYVFFKAWRLYFFPLVLNVCVFAGIPYKEFIKSIIGENINRKGKLLHQNFSDD